jgi:hypothetical protein
VSGSDKNARKFDPTSRLRYHDVAGWSSLVARWAHNPKVEGSNPSPATNPKLHQFNTLLVVSAVRDVCAFGAAVLETVLIVRLAAICSSMISAAR